MAKLVVICKNCQHPIRKKYLHLIGQPKGHWTHQNGGTYCKARWSGNKEHLMGCLCNNADATGEQGGVVIEGND